MSKPAFEKLTGFMAELCIVTKTWRYSIAWIVHSLARALTDAGVSVSLVAPQSEPASREFVSPLLNRIFVPREEVGSGNRSRQIVASLRRIFAGLAATLAERRHTRTFLITIPDPLLFSLPLFFLLRLSGARILFMVHDAIPHAWSLPGFLRKFEIRSHGLSYRLASELIILTPALRRPLEEMFAVPANKITVIPHGPLDLGTLPPPPNAGCLLLFGSLRSNKSVLEVIEGVILARQKDPGISLVIAGEAHPSEREYWERCQETIARDPLGFDVREGFLPDDELPSVIAAVDAFVLAYQRFESQSGVGVLAACSDRPVICTRAGGLRDLIDEGLCHQPIREPVSGQTVAEALLAFRARRFEDWTVEAAASTRRFAETISWQAIARRVVERIQP